MRTSAHSIFLFLACYALTTVAQAQVDLPDEQGEEEFIPPSAQTPPVGRGQAKKEDKNAATLVEPKVNDDDEGGAHQTAAKGTEEKIDEHAAPNGAQKPLSEHKNVESQSADLITDHADTAEAHTETTQHGGNGLVWFGIVFIVLLVLVFALT